MEDYDVDFPAETLLAWIREEHGARRALRLWPSREFVAVPNESTEESGFGDEDDLGETLAVGTLDVQASGRRAHWTLHFRIEDELAAHVPEGEDVPEEPESIDIEAFWSDFVAPARGATHVWLTAESLEAKAAFDRFLRSLEARHAPST